MKESPSSFHDFWEDFEVVPQPERLSFTFVDPKRPKNSAQDYIQDLLETITSMRKSHELDVRMLTEKEKVETYEAVQEAIDGIQQKFETEVGLAKEKNIQMKIEVGDHKKSLSYASRFLTDREVLICQNRMQGDLPIKAHMSERELNEKVKGCHKKTGLVRLKIEALKEAIKSYRHTTENAIIKKALLTEELALKKIRNTEELKQFEQDGNRRISEMKEVNEKLKLEVGAFRVIKTKELLDVEKRCNDNKDLIERLQNELKDAKNILKNPVLKLRVHDTLQEYLNDYKNLPKTAGTNKRIEQSFMIKPKETRVLIEPQESTNTFKLDFSPVISKLNLSSRKTSYGCARTKVSRSSVQFNNSSQFISNVFLNNGE